MTTVSERIAEWVGATDCDSIPQEVINVAKRSILDFIGVALAGSAQPAGQVVKQYLNEVRAAEQCTVIGSGIKTSSVDAAFANGVFGHCLDFDDLLRPVAGAGAPHITTVILPAALAVAESEGKSGKALLEAYILGSEITYRIGRGMEPSHSTSGFHNTATEGIFGATVAAGKLLGLTHEEMTYALGISGSEASGLYENFGTMTKPFHAGQAAAKGVRASLLAKLGFNSSKRIFEGERGFCNVLSKDPRIEEITKDLGQPFGLSQICLKLYPCCAGSHPAIYAALELAREQEVREEDIEQVVVRCEPQITKVVTYENPQTPLEGKFSFHFPIALALSERRVTLQGFTDEKIKNPRIVALMQRVKVVPTPELSQTDPMGRSQIVEVWFRDGKQLTRRCDYFPGSPRNPLSDEEILGKYRSCAGLVLPEKETEETIEMIMDLERIDKVDGLLNLVG